MTTRFAETNDTDDAMPPDVMDQIRRSRGRLAVMSHSNATLLLQAAADELTKIFAAYDRDQTLHDRLAQVRAIWSRP